MPSLPLGSLRVVELGDGSYGHCGQALARLGAEVILVEPPGGLSGRAEPPIVDGQSLPFLASHSDKHSVTIETATPKGQAELGSLLESADIVIVAQGSIATDPQTLAATAPEAIVLSITPFGLTGPYSDYRANNAAMMALGGVLARSGIAGNEPLMPPGKLSLAATGAQAAWVVLVAYYQRLRGGPAGMLDFSAFEATVQVIDPGMGVTGSAAGGRSALELAPRGRPPVGTGYPFFRCRDGFVRVCVLNPRQWSAMSAWLGPDHAFTDPKFGDLATRFGAAKEINGLIAELFVERTRDELMVEGQERGIPIASVAEPKEVFSDEQFLARGAFQALAVGEQSQGLLATSSFSIDGERVSMRSSAPVISGNLNLPSVRQKDHAELCSTFSGHAFDGIRVLDLGVIVAGAELGRLMADQGAEVIKIESREYPDGLRQTLKGEAISVSFTQGSRGKRSLGLNLRSEEGLAIFRDLVARADIVLSNFKPGTMESLGLGYEALKAINPGIIVAESSALGNTGPRSRSMGYGPLVRASTGLSWLWRYPTADDSFSDATTILPDHLAARVSATAIAALLIRRSESGQGGHVALSQAEVILTAFAEDFLHESLQPGAMQPRGNRGHFDSPDNVFACAGDDEWCVVSVDSDQSWLALCELMGRYDLASDQRFADAAGRVNFAEELERAVAEWALQHSAESVMQGCQNVGVIAGRMQRLDEYMSNAHFAARGFFKPLSQPGLDAPMPTEAWAVFSEILCPPAIKPAPRFAEHTRDIAVSVLNLAPERIEELIAAGVLQESQ